MRDLTFRRGNRDMMINMLRLCPSDNLGKRMILPAILVLADRPEQALSFAQGWIENEEAHPDGSTPPSKTPLTPAFIGRQRKWGCAEHYYSAALAAFRLWGDCEIARQYLHMGARLNPAVLRKVLAQKEQPRECLADCVDSRIDCIVCNRWPEASRSRTKQSRGGA